MPRIGSGKRYAQAAFELAMERNEPEAWQEGLNRIAGLTKDEALMSLLENPKLAFNAQKSVLQERLPGINPSVLNLAFILVSRAMLRLASDISQQYNYLLDSYRGIEHAEVTAAVGRAHV